MLASIITLAGLLAVTAFFSLIQLDQRPVTAAASA